MNKKLFIFLVSTLFLAACADKEHYEQVVLEEMQKEQDVKDYKIDPKYMAKCVIDTTYSRMPGLFALDPNRMTAYRNYAKMLTIAKEKDPKKTLTDLSKEFGSQKELAHAHSIYTESVMDCYTAILHEEIDQDDGKQGKG
jgi:hypothetical protein